MKVIAINGSPRKDGNTAILLGKALVGAISKKSGNRNDSFVQFKL